MTTSTLSRFESSPMTGYVLPNTPARADKVELTSTPIREPVELSVESLISPGTGYRLATDARRRNFSESLRSIQQRSGLDWGQIAVGLGVSRRTIHNWIAGAIVNGENAKRITAFYNALIQELRGVGPADARSYLLSTAEDGTTRLSVISAHLREQYKRSRPALSPRDLLAYGPSIDAPNQTGGVDNSMGIIVLDDGDEN